MRYMYILGKLKTVTNIEPATHVFLKFSLCFRLMSYVRKISNFQIIYMNDKEFSYCNGYFQSRSEKAINAGLPDPTPIHSTLLKAIEA